MHDHLHQGIALRLMPLIVGATLLLAATAVLSGGLRFPFSQANSSGLPQLAGMQLDGRPAPDFDLTDQANAPLSLSSLRGEAVSISFLYTSCPDVCPLTASKLLAAYDKLSRADQSRVEILAITVDPPNDNAQRRADFVHAQGLDGVLHFLGGSASDLSRTWSAYHIGVTPVTPEGGSAGATTINHNTVTYVIDPKGIERVLLDDQEFTPDDLAGDFSALLSAATSTSALTPSAVGSVQAP